MERMWIKKEALGLLLFDNWNGHLNQAVGMDALDASLVDSGDINLSFEEEVTDLFDFSLTDSPVLISNQDLVVERGLGEDDVGIARRKGLYQKGIRIFQLALDQLTMAVGRVNQFHGSLLMRAFFHYNTDLGAWLVIFRMFARFPLFHSPLMAASFELGNGFFRSKPGQLVKIFQGLADFLVAGDLIEIGWVVVVGISVAGIKILICLAVVAADGSSKAQFFDQFTL